MYVFSRNKNIFFKVIVVFSSFNRTEPEKRLARIISQLRAKKKIQLDLTCYFDVDSTFDIDSTSVDVDIASIN